MATGLDPKQIVSFEELLIPQVVQQEALPDCFIVVVVVPAGLNFFSTLLQNAKKPEVKP